VFDWVRSADFDRMLEHTIVATYPEHERDRFREHFRGLIDLWIGDEQNQRSNATV
jgi:hypothetical protein